MTKITFKDLPDTSTPLNANNLKTLQDNVENAINVVAGDIPTIDSSVSTSSTNPVENQAITNYVDDKVLDTYSTTEQRIGTWIDGKPLYRRILEDTLGTTNAGWKSIQLTSSNYIKKVISITAMFEYSNGNDYSIPFFRGTDDNYANREYCLCNTTPSNGTFNIIARHPSNYAVMSGQPFYAIILYTKSSDYS